jgi:hypothetical protein
MTPLPKKKKAPDFRQGPSCDIRNSEAYICFVVSRGIMLLSIGAMLSCIIMVLVSAGAGIIIAPESAAGGVSAFFSQATSVTIAARARNFFINTPR